MSSLSRIAAFTAAAAFFSLARARPGHTVPGHIIERQIPADPTGVKEIVSSQGAKIRYKQPGKQGICETKEGVDDYSGYISLDEKTNMFFWYFEARENPKDKPVCRSLYCVVGLIVRILDADFLTFS